MRYKALYLSIGYVGRAIYLHDVIGPLERLKRARACVYVRTKATY